MAILIDLLQVPVGPSRVWHAISPILLDTVLSSWPELSIVVFAESPISDISGHAHISILKHR